MLSLSSETCVALLRRIADTSTEEALMLAPVAERLDKLVTISKQALWETRHYMFTLKPLMSGSTTLTQMLTNQLREFEAISGLPAHLEVEISDDGKGLHTAPHAYGLQANGERERIYSGHGMRGMRERAEELGGTFEIRQAPAGGTIVLARIPI